jgi:hypothetical protein
MGKAPEGRHSLVLAQLGPQQTRFLVCWGESRPRLHHSHSPSGEVLSNESFLKTFSVERSESFSMDQRR